MKQEMIAGMILCVMSVGLLLLPSNTLWKITEKWKTKGNGEASNQFIVIIRVLGLVFAAVGGGLLILG